MLLRLISLTGKKWSFWNEYLNDIFVLDIKEDNVIPVFEQLFAAVKRENIPASKDIKFKSYILKTIYTFVEVAGETLLLHITRIALMVGADDLY